MLRVAEHHQPISREESLVRLVRLEHHLLGRGETLARNARHRDDQKMQARRLGRAEVIGIAAVDQCMGLGRGPHIPWKSPSDMGRFRRATEGSVLIMGRVTANSIGKKLPNRTIIAISRSGTGTPFADYSVMTPERAIEMAQSIPGASRIFVAGGAQIYAALGDRLDRLDLTNIPGDFDCDVLFPTAIKQRFCHLIRETRGYSNGEELTHESWLFPK